MNQGARGIIEWIKAAYDRLVLFVVLFVLLMSVILLGIFVDSEKKQLVAASWNQPDVPLVNSKPVDTRALHDAIESLAEPFQMGVDADRMMVAEPRVACDKCGRPIPASAEACTYKSCGFVQQPYKVEDKPADTDLDLMPDTWEWEHNLDPTVDDSWKDADGDRWSNLEEYKAGTDPQDPDDHPPAVSKLRWIRTQWTTLPYSFQSILHPAQGETVFVLKNRSIDRDYYVQMGETTDEGYEIIKFEPKTKEVEDTRISSKLIVVDISVLTLRKGDKTIALTLGQDTQRGELAAELIYLVDNSKYPVKVNYVVSLKNEKYKIVDIQKTLVVVSNVLTGVTTSLEKYSDVDRQRDAER